MDQECIIVETGKHFKIKVSKDIAYQDTWAAATSSV